MFFNIDYWTDKLKKPLTPGKYLWNVYCILTNTGQ